MHVATKLHDGPVFNFVVILYIVYKVKQVSLDSPGREAMILVGNQKKILRLPLLASSFLLLAIGSEGRQSMPTSPLSPQPQPTLNLYSGRKEMLSGMYVYMHTHMHNNKNTWKCNGSLIHVPVHNYV